MKKKDDEVRRIEITGDEELEIPEESAVASDDVSAPDTNDVGDEKTGKREPFIIDFDSDSGVVSDMYAEVETLKAKAEEAQNLYVRTLADFDNFRKRQRDELARQKNWVREDIILKLLPIVDNFERSVQAAEASESYEALVEGVTLVLRLLRDLLEKEGLEKITAVGEEFNPEMHEAIQLVETDEHPENTVIDELEAGYVLDGRVIRPARVRVATSGS